MKRREAKSRRIRRRGKVKGIIDAGSYSNSSNRKGVVGI